MVIRYVQLLLSSNAIIEQCAWNQDYVLSVAVSHDGRWVVSGSKDRGVQFWEAQTAQMQLMLQGHKNSGTTQNGHL